MVVKSIKDILKSRKETRRFITREFQDYGYRLAESLNDLKHKSLYIKLAKEEKRDLLHKAWDFVKDSRAKSKAKLFMWKLKQLKTSSSPARGG
jgi:protein-arginine kinase